MQEGPFFSVRPASSPGHLFPAGQGNVIGNPIEPALKLTANGRLICSEILGHRELVFTHLYQSA